MRQGTYIYGLSEKQMLLLRELAEKLGHYNTRGPATGQGSIAELFRAIADRYQSDNAFVESLRSAMKYHVQVPKVGWKTDLLPDATSLHEQSWPRAVAYTQLDGAHRLAVSLVEQSHGVEVEDAVIEVWQQEDDMGYWVEDRAVRIQDVEVFEA